MLKSCTTMKNSDVSSEDEASDMSASSTDLPEHCVQLTRDQYQSLCQCHTHPLFKKAVLPLSHPSWEELMAASQPIDHCLSWWIHRYWLGSLKYALLSKEVEGGEELYSKIFAIYEELVADFDETAFFPPNTRWLVFNHIGRGVFQLRLSAAQEGRKRVFKSKLASLPTEEECKREIRVLAAEAMHVSRGSAWPKYGKNFYEHVASLPLAILEEEDSDVGEEKEWYVSACFDYF